MVIEIPRDSWNSCEVDHDNGLIRLDRTLFTSTVYPAGYGFVPDTLLADDPELQQSLDQRPADLGPFPIRDDDRYDLLVDQPPHGAEVVPLLAGFPPQTAAFGEVAPVAMMLGSAGLLRAWVLSTLGGLAADDEHQALLRETLLIFLQSGGSYKLTAERLMLHKRIRSSTGSARPRKASAARWTSISMTSNSRCEPANG